MGSTVATPDEAGVKALPLACREEPYGSPGACIVEPDRPVVELRTIQAELSRIEGRLWSSGQEIRRRLNRYNPTS